MTRKKRGRIQRERRVEERGAKEGGWREKGVETEIKRESRVSKGEAIERALASPVYGVTKVKTGKKGIRNIAPEVDTASHPSL